MNSPEFLHGIDEVGQAGVAPLLCVGGKISDSDFAARDLSSVAGLIISERGLPPGTEWHELNVRLIGERLKNLRYLWIEFSKNVDLNDLGIQEQMSHVKLFCPKLKRVDKQLFPTLVDAELTVPDADINSLLSNCIQAATIIRPKFQDLRLFENCRSLVTLDVHYARNLASLAGLSRMPALNWLGLHDCPALFEFSGDDLEPGPVEMMFGGCKRLMSLDGVERMNRLKVVSVLGPGPEIFVPPTLSSRGVEVVIKGRRRN